MQIKYFKIYLFYFQLTTKIKQLYSINFKALNCLFILKTPNRKMEGNYEKDKENSMKIKLKKNWI